MEAVGELSNKTPLLHGKELYLTYSEGETPALNGVSLSLGQGELCGLIGPNGAGKTTLISVFTTLLRPERGSLSICGIDVLKHPAKIRTKIGYVPQELALYDQLTGIENICYFGRMYGLEKKDLAEKSKYYLNMFGLYQKAGRRVATYSGGMKRRINLIIGIIHDPYLLFLDEPTVGIDAHSRHLIIEKLADLNDENMAMVYTSHYIEEVQRLCRKIVVIDEGVVVAEGSPENLIAEAGGCGNLADFFMRKTGAHLRD